MSTKSASIDSTRFLRAWPRPSGLDKLGRRIALSRLALLEEGQVVLSENGRHHTFGRLTDDLPLTARIRVHDPRFFGDIAFGGSIGAGEAYIRGYWSCDELGDLLRIVLRNRDVMEKLDGGLAAVGRPLQKLFHILHRNSRKGSRKNIAAHYDLGNDFYRLWLDPKMMYSCAWFDTPDTSLEDASTAKLDRICRRLDLGRRDSVVEIGTGWGGFAIHAARHYGCHVTTTTISRQQHDYAARAIREAGLEDRITLLFEDYRELHGQFDKLVSIEMIEAVGHEFHATFFEKCRDLLTPNGQMLLQAITIADQRYDGYKNDVDFIRRYVFPGGCLTSVTDLTRTMTQHTDMRVIHLDDIGPHYALTLRHWYERFRARLDAVRNLGHADEFVRLWEFYLLYCESAFTERVIGNVQMHIVRPAARNNPFAV